PFVNPTPALSRPDFYPSKRILNRVKQTFDVPAAFRIAGAIDFTEWSARVSTKRFLKRAVLRICLFSTLHEIERILCSRLFYPARPCPTIDKNVVIRRAELSIIRRSIALLPADVANEAIAP